MAVISSRWRRPLQILLLILITIGLYGVVPQLAHFRASLQAIHGAAPGAVVLALLSIMVSYGLAALSYCLLSFKPLRYGRTLLIELAGLFVNRIVPAGLGGLGFNYAYLRANRHTATQAGSIVTINNVLGLVGHLLLAIIIISLHPANVASFHLPRVSGQHLELVIVVFGLTLSGVVVVIFRQRQQSRHFLQRLQAQLAMVRQYYQKRLGHLLGAIICSMALTLANVLCLWFCSRAIGLALNFLTVFLIFTLSVTIGTATPTPGGVGGTEAALVAGFVASHVSTTLGLAAALLYRVITFWLSLLIGIIAFLVVRRRHYV